MPYLEGELDETRTAELSARLATDPEMAEEAERLRHTLSHLRQSATRTPDTAANSAVPADLWPRLHARLEPAPPPRRPAQTWWMAGVGATAAMAFAAIWLPMHRPPMPDQFVGSKSPQMSSNNAPRVVSPPIALKTALNPAPAKVEAARKPTPHSEQVALSVPEPPAVSYSNPFTIPAASPSSKLSIRPQIAPAPASKTVPASKPILMAANPSFHSTDGLTVGQRNAPLPDTAQPVPTAQMEPTPAPIAAVPPPPPAPPKPEPPAPAAPPPATLSITAPTKNGVNAAIHGRAVHSAEVSTHYEIHSQIEQQTKSQPNNLYQFPGLVFGKAGTSKNGTPAGKSQSNALSGAAKIPTDKPKMFVLAPQSRAALGVRRDSIAKHAAPARAADTFGQAMDADDGQILDKWQASLAQSVQTPLLGDEAGMQQANQALMAARESGSLDALRARLEARRTQSPQDIVTGRMLAAVYEFGFSSEPALRERRRIVGLEGATGEDWFALAEDEGRAGNSQAARLDYKRALDAPAPLSSFHAALARQRE